MRWPLWLRQFICRCKGHDVDSSISEENEAEGSCRWTQVCKRCDWRWSQIISWYC